MFVYQKATSQEASSPVLVVMASLLFGGVARLTAAIPLAAFVFTVLALCWSVGESSEAEEPAWVPRLSLAATGLFYLGLGYSLGSVAFCLIPLFWKLARNA